MSTGLLRKIGQYIVYITFFTPLIFLPKLFVFPYVVPKIVFFRSLVLLLTSLVFVIYWYERKKHNKKEYLDRWMTPLTVMVLLFLVSMIVSTFTGVDSYRSFWDNHERMLGVFTLMHYVLFFVSCRFLFRSWDDWKKLFMVFCGVGFVVLLIAGIQKIDPFFLLNRGMPRMVSTLGNPIYLGGYSLAILFASLLLAIKEKGWLKWISSIVFVLSIYILIVSQTRSAFLGLLIGLFVVGVMYVVFSDINKKIKKIVSFILLGVIICMGVAFLFRTHTVVRQIPIVGKVVNISPSAGTAQTRLMAWDIALTAWKDRPLFGWGPNNYAYAFNAFYNPEFMRHGIGETWFDNAHGVLFNTLATQGSFGLLIFVLMFGFAFYSLIRIYKQDSKNIHIVIFASGFLIAHFFHLFFVFEDVSSYLSFFIFLALIDSFYIQAKRDTVPVISVPTSVVSLSVVIVIGMGLVFATNVNVAQANIEGFYMRNFMSSGEVEKAIEKYEHTHIYNSPFQEDIDWDFAAASLGIMDKVFINDPGIARTMYDMSITAMETYIAQHPKDVRARLMYMDLLRSGGIVLFGVEGVKEEVEEQLRISAELSPDRQQVDYARVTFMAALGNFDEALEVAKNIVVRDPKIADGYYTLGRLYKFDKQYKMIYKTMDEAMVAGIEWGDPDQMLFAAETYEREGRFNDALYWYDQLYKKTGNERVLYKRDELSRLTKKDIPQAVEDFYDFERIQRNLETGFTYTIFDNPDI